MSESGLTPWGAGRTEFNAEASGDARVYQAGRDLHITEGEQHFDSPVHNEFRGTAEFVIQARDISAPVTYAPTTVSASDDPPDRAGRELARMVSAQWREEAGVRGLLDPVALPVRWTADWEDSADGLPVTSGGQPGDGGLKAFVDAFRHAWNRRLVVLGGPGAGKSTLAVLLLLNLLAHAAPGDPVPVLFSMASWDPAQEHFHAWLARRVLEDYPRLRHSDFGGDESALRLVEAQRVMPVLDGLDEIPPRQRILALQRLNESLAGGAPVILTCRSSEYEDAVREVQELRSTAVVRANPVQRQDALAHLRAAVDERSHPRWQPVFSALEKDADSPVTTALTTPLMIGLILAAYAHPTADTAHLVDTDRFPDTTTIENHLLDSLTRTIFSQTPARPGHPGTRHQWASDKAERWLRQLAEDLTRQATEDLAWWQFHLPPWGRERFAKHPVRGRTATPARLRQRTVLIGIFGLVTGFMLANRSPDWWHAFITGGVYGILGMVGFSISLSSFFLLLAPINRVTEAVSPRKSLSFGRRRTVAAMCTLGVLPPFFVSLLVIPLGSSRVLEIMQTGRGTLFLVFALGASTFLVALAWLFSPWGWFVLVRLWLAPRGRLPWRLMTFLEDAHRLGILRQIGGVYQFRHARLRERLATHR
jgi:hypothetical protein